MWANVTRCRLIAPTILTSGALIHRPAGVTLCWRLRSWLDSCGSSNRTASAAPWRPAEPDIGASWASIPIASLRSLSCSAAIFAIAGVWSSVLRSLHILGSCWVESFHGSLARRNRNVAGAMLRGLLWAYRSLVSGYIAIYGGAAGSNTATSRFLVRFSSGSASSGLWDSRQLARMILRAKLRIQDPVTQAAASSGVCALIRDARARALFYLAIAALLTHAFPDRCHLGAPGCASSISRCSLSCSTGLNIVVG